jgi:hypothetical protein
MILQAGDLGILTDFGNSQPGSTLQRWITHAVLGLKANTELLGIASSTAFPALRASISICSTANRRFPFMPFLANPPHFFVAVFSNLVRRKFSIPFCVPLGNQMGACRCKAVFFGHPSISKINAIFTRESKYELTHK